MALAIIGQTLLLVAFVAALVGVTAGFFAGFRARRSDVGSGGQVSLDISIRALHTVLAAAALATLLVLLALAASDFTLAYVEGRTSQDLPLAYRLTAFWSGQEGSLLLWLTLLSGAGTLMVRALRRRSTSAAMLAFSNGIVLATCAFFALLVALVARPFAVVDHLQTDGAGMSPSLQNYWMAIHPPMLYLGYVGVAIPFAIVAGALLARQRGDEWIDAARPWVIVSWMFLTLGLIVGARWAYEEIGWGGYWAWDPVENAALMPWLTATALMHSVMVQQRRSMMRFWNAVLATLTFALSIFGTFLTRSGVLSSVHSFVSSPVGWWFIGALCVVIFGSLALLYRSRSLLQARHDVEAVVSRESMLLFNNLLLVALMLVILWGVLYPIFTAAFAGQSISLEQPWYNFFATAFGIPLIGLVAFAPFISWHGTPVRRVLRAMAIPILLSIFIGGILILASSEANPAATAAISLGVLVVLGVKADFLRTLKSRRGAHEHESRVRSVWQVIVRHRQRWGAWTAHAGIALVVIAIAGGAWTKTKGAELRVGDTAQISSYTLTYLDMKRERNGASMRTSALFEVRRGDANLGTLAAGRDFHPASGEVSNEVGIRHDWLRMHDLFVAVDRLGEDGSLTIKTFINPLMPLLWLAGILTALGGAIAAVPQRRSQLLTARIDRNASSGVERSNNAVHELRNRAITPS